MAKRKLLFPLFASMGGRRRSVGPPAPTILLYDTFTDTDGTLLTAHTMNVGPGWSITGGTWEILSDECHGGSLAANVLAFADSGGANVNISCTMRIDAPDDDKGLVFRLVDANNMWLWSIRLGVPDMILIEVTGGAANVRDQANIVASHGVEYPLEVQLLDDAITCTFNGNEQLSFSSASHQSATIHGLSGRQSSGSIEGYWDDFLVTEL